MKVTPALKKELAQWLETYWTTYLKGDIETWATFLRDDYRNIGGTKEEIWNSKQEIIDYTNSILSQMLGTVEIRNQEVELIPYGEYMMVHEFTDIYVKAEGEWILYSPFRMSSLLEKTDTGWIAIHQHGSYPDMKAMVGEAFSMDAVKAENAKLLEMVKSRTLQLEIEAALERVRAVAMGMKKPEDMLDVCQAISEQLQQFGVEKIRNVQTAIIDENIGQYLCYQYFTPYDKTTIEKTEYLKSPVEHGMVRQMLASRDGYFIGRLSGKDLEDFRIHRKEENHFPDPFLDKAAELDYCFLSIGEGGLGLTLYKTMAEDVLTLFKRFHQVFSLAYQRFRDIQKAEKQAREAQIEAALERVRAQTMAMHNSEDVGKCVVKMFSELTALGVDEGTRFGIGILNHDNENNQLWTARKDGAEVNMHIGNINMASHPLLKSARQAWKEQIPLHKYVLEGADLLNYYQMLNNAPDYKIQIPIEKLPKKEIQHCFIFEHGFFYAFTPREFQSELIHITKRFSSLFEQTYRRYLDLVKAEAQAREAQVEAALERVRSRTMAMHHTEELKEVIQVVFDQFVGLKIHVDHAGFILDYKEREDMHIWLADHQQGVPTEISIPYFDSPHWNSYLEAKAKQESFFANLLPFEVKNKFYQDLFELIPELTEEAQQAIFSKPALAISTVLLDNVGLYIEHYSMTPYTAEENKILMRFGKVFQQTYTRFLDLQKAEEQAREAQIEAGLERVRARAMAMHKSDELGQAAEVLYKELRILGLSDFINCGYVEIDEQNQCQYGWMTNSKGQSMERFYLPLIGEPILQKRYNAWKRKVPVFCQVVEGKELKDHLSFVNPQLGSQEVREHVKKNFPSPTIFYSGNFSDGYLSFITGTPIGSDGELLLNKFTRVFEMTYKRFLDLRKAEAQARESQIEAGLERVRSRTMAMQKSEELAEVSINLFEQVEKLGIKTWSTGFNVWLEGDTSYIDWVVNSASRKFIEPYKVDLSVHPSFMEISRAKKQGDDFFVHETEGETLEELYRLLSQMAKTQFQDIVKAGFQLPEHQINHYVFGSKVSLMFITFDPCPEAHDIFKRFGKVFEQTYTRFLDLQRAEAQAREAQIEAALEKVRSRSLAMHKSDELKEVVSVLFEKLKDLQIPFTAVGIATNIEGSKDLNAFVCGQNEAGLVITNYRLPYFDNPVPKDLYSAIEKQLDYFVGHYSKEEKDSFYEYVIEHTDEFRHLPEDIKRMIFDSTNYTISMVSVKNAVFNVNDFEGKVLAESEIDIIKRFARVFDQAYIRFLDLQKAEAQAREAQIEAGLERVRSKSLAMHKTAELQSVIHTVHQELLNLNISISGGSFIVINSEIDNEIQCWGSGGTADTSDRVHIPHFEKPFYTHLLNGIKNGPNFFTEEYTQEEKIEFFTFLFHHEPWSKLSAKEKKNTLSAPGGYTRSCAVAKHTSIFIINHFGEKFSEAENAILKRFGKVFEQSYTRFLDLQKAEAQAREAEIQLALERVRARTMAMQKSDELRETIGIIFEQLVKLGFDVRQCSVSLIDHEKREIESFQSAEVLSVLPQSIKTPFIEGPLFDKLVKGGIFNKSGYTVNILEGEDKVAFDDYIFQYTPFQFAPEEVAAFMRSVKKLIICRAHMSFGFVEIVTNDEPISSEEADILQRLSQVFEQTYIRFLDLQKAEAQAREAQIEAALERVRSRSMAMRKSEELADLSLELVKQVQALGVATWFCAFNIYMEDGSGSLEWGSNGEGTFPRYVTPREGIFLRYYEAGQQGESLLVNEIGANECPAHYDYLCSLPGVGDQLLKMKEAGIPFPTAQIDHVAYFKYGYLLFITYEPTPESHDIFKRFAKVFEQTYTRFLDLQKAESQAREAKVEAALEKVRSRTMGMQSSDELQEVANIMFLEIQTLNIPAWSCGYNILSADKKVATNFMSNEGTIQKPFDLPLTKENSLLEFYHFLQSEESFFTQELEGKALESHYNFMKSLPELTPVFNGLEEAGIALPTYQINHLCKFTHGYLLFITYKPVQDAHDIFKRFTKVFDQTYTRFLDLQKAEKQAREAQIENALEKVRSRSLAMQSPDELIEVAQLLREEMGALGVEELETSSIYIQDESSGLTQCWFTIKNPDNPGKAITDQMTIDLQDTWVGRKMDEFYRSKGKQTSILMQGEGRIEWIRYCEKKSDLFGTSNFYGETIPDRTYHLYKFSNGYIGAAAPGEISSESWELLKRATTVFSFAYTRFRDLQMAQASARTAMRQASLDRVRADISSMRNADDLDRITPLIFKELTVLGVPFIRCGVFIIQEKQKIVEAYLSSPEGNSLGVLRLPYKASELTYQTVEAWRKGEVYKQHWNKEDFIQWINQLMKEDQIQDGSTYQGTAAPPESLDLHFVPFAQGMLYVGAVCPLDEKELELVQTLAKAFSIAYARFEDFVKLEQAKAEVESAMSELKATQSQLVQQEKLASLGQLTAGIAHEIKNPLNFVNNFSEVSIEMIEEIQEERSKSQETRDETLVDEILEDIKSNLQKVHQHGSRANGIVTSMLQHSRGGSGKKEPTDLNALIKEYVNLSFHGMRAGKNPINVEIVLDLDPDLGMVSLIKEDFTRVVINLCNNAFDAMREKVLKTEDGRRKTEDGAVVDGKYLPKLKVTTMLENGRVRLLLEDNGPGIPDEIRDKILQPFFTTKKGTEGTGLGLSITHDIIKAHGGELKVETKIGEGTTFIIDLEKKA
ncbi:His Kinase A (phospho-acceptor) domain-containing protein [Aquiflexum balticum DSM 16537]|uniref:histidine kinase n=1 Tax=Aquiflexum balticum DSM 16537 TaxID=758820 RepID=A0A1W2H2W0_9BACT|nr:ATP-binding protein [Aquiflexum balticum]SMD42826.1 His Kinase A (phospho-acceptor) domain-containing protein [Aquiflexum balticum DSM 16537]